MRLTRLILLSSIALAGVMAQAQPQLRIISLNCTNAQPGTATTVTYSGDWMGSPYFNITSVGPVMIPFTQQAQLINVRFVAGVLSFDLRTMLTNATVTLSLKNGTNEGRLSMGNQVLPMKCFSNIVRP